jgi:hypothetical protein
VGLLLEERLVPTDETRRRVLSLWEPGVRVLRVEGGLMVRFARPRPLDAALAPGHVLLDVDGALVAAPIPPTELATLAPPPGALVVVRAGEAVALPPGVEEDPAAWLDLAPVVSKVESLGPFPTSPGVPPPPPEPDVRLVLAVPPAAATAGAAVRALRTARTGAKQPSRAGASGLAAFGLLGRSASALFGVLREELSLLAGAFSTPGGAEPARAISRPVIGPPSAPGPLRRVLRRAWGRFLLLSRIARIAGFRQGAYLGRLLGMFERGDLQEALRHALPLGGANGLADIPALGLPAVRAGLVINPQRGGAGSTISVGDALLAEMRRVYRRAFEQLEASGRHEEAAFVLAELLRADEEAVSFLERHGKLRLAAELAEARGLPPGLCVRQWFLAEDAERAIRLARARHAFADAVERLERSRRGREAGALRVLWAEELAEAGDFEAAVEVAAKVDDAGPLVRQWIDLAVAAGGTAGHALLPLLADLRPERFTEVRDRVFEACADGGDDGPWRRGAIARGFARVPPSDRARILARAVLRGRLADGALGRSFGSAPPQLAQLASDGAFDADLPSSNPVRTAPPLIELRLRADDCGARAGYDAAVLPNGRVLVALGEAGVALLGRDGHEMARFDAPAHHLVVSDHGSRALALGQRGEAHRVTRLDLDARTARPLRDLRLRSWANSFDGSTWAVASDRSVLLLDALREDLRTLWHVSDLPGHPLCLERSVTAMSLSFVTRDADSAAEGWLYSMPDPTLRQRDPLPAAGGESGLGLDVFTRGAWFSVVKAQDDAAGQLLRSNVEKAVYRLDPRAEAVALIGGGQLAVLYVTPESVVVRLFESKNLTPLAAVALDGDARASVRIEGQRVTIADARGRLIGLDLALGRVTHDLRL